MPATIGMEGAGVIEAVGEGVTHLKVGDRAAYASNPPGAYCELRVMPAKCVCKLPDAISFETGAAMILIFLMLTTTYSKFTELQLTLPVADAEQQRDHPKEVIVSVAADGRYAVNKTGVEGKSVDAIAQALRSAATAGRDSVVIISADASARHQSPSPPSPQARLARAEAHARHAHIAQRLTPFGVLAEREDAAVDVHRRVRLDGAGIGGGDVVIAVAVRLQHLGDRAEHGGPLTIGLGQIQPRGVHPHQGGAQHRI
eukprot:gene11901-15924_t